MISNSWEMDERPGFPRGKASFIIFSESHKEEDLKRGNLGEGGGEDKGARRTGGNNFKVAIWVGETVMI